MTYNFSFPFLFLSPSFARKAALSLLPASFLSERNP